jgi:hypothetical protein
LKCTIHAQMNSRLRVFQITEFLCVLCVSAVIYLFPVRTAHPTSES